MVHNLHHNDLPQGCKLCLRGLKTIIFITGLCNINCFYCPISRERKGRDVIYVNDVCANLITILEELEASMSMGVAITGGEPTLVIDRVVELCRFLKRNYGENFHIHLYTNPASWNKYRAFKLLNETPLDEIRLHIVNMNILKIFLNYVKFIRNSSSTIGLEVPVIPGFHEDLYNVVKELYYRDIIEFVNLNELDVSESNYENLIRAGLLVERGRVKGSYEICVKVFNDLCRMFPDLKIHLCSSYTKDNVQIRLRMFIRSIYYSTLYHKIQDDGSVIRQRGNVMFREVLIGRSFKVFEQY
ncbi:MAG: radical SAM protein [Crenarchaeota archaeon]|nr:radical SAM protein [Thermoproteota archaeon]